MIKFIFFSRSMPLLVAFFASIQLLSAQVTVKGEGLNGTDMMFYHKIVLTVDGSCWCRK